MAYSSVSISGYNSSPPPDDGSQTEANKVCWSKIKEKLTDPLKTALESINSQVASELTSIASTYLSNADTIYFQATGSATSVVASTWTKLEPATEELESSHDDYDNATNYRFTPEGAGLYLVFGMCKVDPNSSGQYDPYELRVYKNGSGIGMANRQEPASAGNDYVGLNVQTLVSMNGSTDYVELFGYHEGASAENFADIVFAAVRLTSS